MTTIRVNAIINNNGQYLLLKRSPEDGGFWQTLTGTVDGEENLLDTVRREAIEEAGITDLTIQEEPIHYFTWKKGKADVVELVYLCQTEQRDIKLSSEHTEYQWVDHDQAEGIVEKTNNKVSIQKAETVSLSI